MTTTQNPSRWWQILEYPELEPYVVLDGKQLKEGNTWAANISPENDAEVLLKLPALAPFDDTLEKSSAAAHIFAYQHSKTGINIYVSEVDEGEEPDEIELQYLGVKGALAFNSPVTGDSISVLFCESVEMTHRKSSFTINVADESFVNENGDIIITRSSKFDSKVLNQRTLYVDEFDAYQEHQEELDYAEFQKFLIDNNPWVSGTERAERSLGSLLVSGGINEHFNAIEGKTFYVKVDKKGTFEVSEKGKQKIALFLEGGIIQSVITDQEKGLGEINIIDYDDGTTLVEGGEAVVYKEDLLHKPEFFDKYKELLTKK